MLSSREGQTETSDDAAIVSTPSSIPHPPVIGFVARRDEQGRDIVERLKEELAQDKGEVEEARLLYDESLEIAKRLGSPNAEIVRESLARVEGGPS